MDSKITSLTQWQWRGVSPGADPCLRLLVYLLDQGHVTSSDLGKNKTKTLEHLLILGVRCDF